MLLQDLICVRGCHLLKNLHGSLFAALLDTVIACGGFIMAWQRQDSWILWTLTAFFGALALREWYFYIHRNEV